MLSKKTYKGVELVGLDWETDDLKTASWNNT
jgi:hypothetical protein